MSGFGYLPENVWMSLFWQLAQPTTSSVKGMTTLRLMSPVRGITPTKQTTMMTLVLMMTQVQLDQRTQSKLCCALSVQSQLTN